jgi:hypothetical protein
LRRSVTARARLLRQANTILSNLHAAFLSALDDEEPTADRKLPKVISPVDPCSAWTAKANKRVQFGYGLNYLIDIENAVIVDVEATPARTYDEVAATKTMIKRTDERLGLKPKRLAADTAYGTAFDKDRNEYICPKGKLLTTTGRARMPVIARAR